MTEEQRLQRIAEVMEKFLREHEMDRISKKRAKLI